MNREQLLKGIECVLPGIDKSGSPLGMDFLVFDKGWMRSFNDSISVSFFADSPLVVHCAVKAQELYKVVSKMEGNNVRMVPEPTRLVVKSPNTTLKMSIMEDKQLKLLEERLSSLDTDNLQWEGISKELINGLEICSFSTRNDPTLGVLSGVAVKDSQIFATDNNRISVLKMTGTFESEFVLSVDVVPDLVKYAKDSNKISVTNAWVHFKTPSELIISTRRIVGEYPYDKVQEVLKNNTPKEGVKPYTFPNGLEKSLSRVETLAEVGPKGGSPSFVHLRKEGKNLIVCSGNDTGEVEDKLEWVGESEVEKMEIKISPDFLRKALKITREFRISPNENSILLGTPNFKHLMVAEVKGA